MFAATPGTIAKTVGSCLLVVLPAMLIWGAQQPATAPAPVQYAPASRLARLANTDVGESSGLAASRLAQGVFWTHNDSGDRARIFAFNDKGEDLGTYSIAGATAVDWEDMASFSLGQKHFLLIADVGDNDAGRKSCTLYFVAEPAVQPEGPLAGAKPAKPVSLPVAARVDFVYEDGPRNCESVGVDAVRKEILLVSKTAGRTCTAYILALPTENHVKNVVAKAVGTLEIPTATAMDVSPDGLRALVLTYLDAYEYTRAAAEDWKAAFARRPRIIKMPWRIQGESICYGLDGRTLFLTSEGSPCPLLRIPPAMASAPAGK